MNGSELQGQGYARVIYHDRREEHEGSSWEEVTCRSSSESLITESRWRVVAGINYRNNLEQPIHWASRFFGNISLLFPASIKLALEMELLSCISDLAAFDLDENTVVFKMTWRTTRWIWGTRPEYFNEKFLQNADRKREFLLFCSDNLLFSTLETCQAT